MGKYLKSWWLFQIQFIITGVHAMLGLFASNCNFPKYLIAIGIPQDIFMFSLFWDFYRRTYLKPNKPVPENMSKNGAFDAKNKKEWSSNALFKPLIWYLMFLYVFFIFRDASNKKFVYVLFIPKVFGPLEFETELFSCSVLSIFFHFHSLSTHLRIQGIIVVVEERDILF